MIYAYKCRTCGHEKDSTYRGDALGPCTNCETGVLTRRFAVTLEKPMMAHFNQTTQQEVSSMGKFKDQLKRGSEEYYLRTGIETDYRPKEWGELTKGNDTGIDAANAERVKQGLAPISLPKPPT